MKGEVVVLEKGISLPEGAAVRIELEANGGCRDSVSRKEDLFDMGALAVETGITDLATNADHYLYGHPKLKNAG